MRSHFSLTSIEFTSTGIAQSALPSVDSFTSDAGISPILVTVLRQSCAWMRSFGMEPNIHLFSASVCGTCCPSVGMT